MSGATSPEGSGPVLVVLGSNIEPEANLVAAVRFLSELVTVEAASPAYRSAPVGSPGSPPFLNAAVALSTDLSPGDLKREVLRPIEAALGRVRGADRNAPRTIDLDLALYGALVVDDRAHGLVLPDPAILEHAHVAVPLADLAPGFEHPVTGERLASIAARLAPLADLERLDGLDLLAAEGKEPRGGG